MPEHPADAKVREEARWALGGEREGDGGAAPLDGWPTPCRQRDVVLTSARVAGSTTTYAYDGNGKRFSSTTGGVTARSVCDAAGGLPVLLDDGMRSYVWGPQGLAYSAELASGALSVAHTDGLGSIRALTDSSTSVEQTYGTDEFGVPDAALTQRSSSQPLGFTGDSGGSCRPIRFARAGRAAAAGTGSGGRNRYTYVGSYRATYADPSGEVPILLLLAAAGFARAGIAFLGYAAISPFHPC